ncbi:MAG: DUF1588 domain-containing protein [Rubripirellula sp.]|nr:DUF1588 domain-containing protein [Rubripirellula sp.]
MMRLYLPIPNAKICHGHTPPMLCVVLWVAAFALSGPYAALAAEPVDDSLHVSEEGLSQFLGKWCSDCHGPETQESGLRFDTLSQQWDDPNVAAQWRQIEEQVLFREMPPDGNDAADAVERKRFVEAVESQLQTHGHGFGLADKMLLPEYGNLLDHDTLFSGEVKEKPYTSARLWRQRPGIYKKMWGPHYGQQHWISVKIGGGNQATARNRVQHGPHKGKAISKRYFANEKFANPFFEYVHRASGITDYASIMADQASLEALLTNAESMAEILTLGLPVTVVTEVKNKDSRHGNNHGSFVGGVETISHERRGRIPVAFHRIMETEKEVSEADFRDALQVAFNLFLRRKPGPQDVEHYWHKVFQKNAGLGNTTALQAMLIYIAISPEFVYRMETGLTEPDEDGRRFLSPHELVGAIHYAFHNTPAFGVSEFETIEKYTKNSDPLVKNALTQEQVRRHAKHGWLVERMNAGQLHTREDVEKVIREILGARSRNLNPNHNSDIDSVTNARILQFFREFFGYHKAQTVFKDVEKFAGQDEFQHYHSHTPVRLMYDTDALILHILQEDTDVLQQLLTTNKVFVSYWNGTNPEDQIKRAGGRDKYVAKHDSQSYNLDPFEYQTNGKVAITAPTEQRCGILTQPSWLVAHSGNFDNDPVRRGKWIREKLLAGAVIDVPITVDAQIPDDESKTLRERFSVVRNEYCWRCHRKMNPLGMPFEAYNHVGRFRELEKGKPVDTSGAVHFNGGDQFSGEVSNVREMMEALAKAPKVRQSFLRHMFRFWMGRNESLRDSKTLIAMDMAYVESGGSFKETLVALLTSDSFLYRK